MNSHFSENCTLLNFNHYYQGTRIRVEFGDSATTIDSKCADIVAQAFPRTFGQKLVHFLGPSMTVPDVLVKEEQPPIRLIFHILPS
jgi:diphosphate-dependent phosphofructokinase